jgi:hypothetical protein
MTNVFLGKMMKTIKQNKAMDDINESDIEDNIDDPNYQQSATKDGNGLLLFFLLLHVQYLYRQ